jgi:type I protein arginine methyltransferase
MQLKDGHESHSAGNQNTDGQQDHQQATDEQTLGQYIPLVYHYNMLQDTDRVNAFRDAIELIVRPEMHVVELGGGTGILSSFAARQGARVTCVERNPELVSCARRFIRNNGLNERVEVIRADASQYVPDSPVDVVICEMLHVGLLREKQAQVISSFKRRYMAIHGPKLPTFIPEASILMVQPVQQCFEFAGYTAPIPMFQAPLLDQPRTRELTTLVAYANIAYDDFIPMSFRVSQAVIANQSGRVNAMRFVTQNVLGIEMSQQRAITWPNQCLVLPLSNSFEVVAGQEIMMSFEYETGGSIGSLHQSIQVAANDHVLVG